MRLDLAKLARVEVPEPGEPVRLAAAPELLEPVELAVVDGDDELPELRILDPVLVGEGDQQLPTFAAKPGLQRAGRVVQTRVDDTRVSSALVSGVRRLLVHHH